MNCIVADADDTTFVTLRPVNIESSLTIDRVNTKAIPYIDTQIQGILSQLSTVNTRLDTVEVGQKKPRVTSHDQYMLNIIERDQLVESRPFYVRQRLLEIEHLILTNENMRLQIELQKLKNNAVTTIESPASDAETDMQTARQMAAEWITRNLPNQGCKVIDPEKVTDYYNRYTDDHEFPLPAKAFEFIARGVLGVNPVRRKYFPNIRHWQLNSK